MTNELQEQHVIRWIVDCWSPGCGWSRVGWNTDLLARDAELHRKERHHDE